MVFSICLRKTCGILPQRVLTVSRNLAWRGKNKDWNRFSSKGYWKRKKKSTLAFERFYRGGTWLLSHIWINSVQQMVQCDCRRQKVSSWGDCFLILAFKEIFKETSLWMHNAAPLFIPMCYKSLNFTFLAKKNVSAHEKQTNWIFLYSAEEHVDR